MVWMRSEREDRFATLNARMASTVPSLPLGTPLARLRAQRALR